MSLKPTLIQPVPEGTARVAKAAFRKGNPLLSPGQTHEISHSRRRSSEGQDTHRNG